MPPQNNSRNTIIFIVIASIMLLAYSYFVMQPQAALGAVADDRPADLAGGREAEAHGGLSVCAIETLHDHGAAGL